MNDFRAKLDQLAIEATNFASEPLKRFNEAMREADKAVKELREAGLCVTIHGETNSYKGMVGTTIIISLDKDLPQTKEAWR
jgi:hypothetical protein